MNLRDIQQLVFGVGQKHTLTPGEKTQTLLRALTDQVCTMLIEQRPLFMKQSRPYFIRTLAENLQHWTPPGLSLGDIESIPSEWYVGMVRNIVDGVGLGGYEERLYAHFLAQEERISDPVDMPDVPEPARRDHQVTRRRYPRRRLP